MYLQEFNSIDDVIESYSAPKDALYGAEVLLAWYGYGSYCGSSYVLFRKDGKLYEVTGGHCSCYGLEGQWEPEETTIAALELRDLRHSDEGCEEAHEHLQTILAQLKAA